MSKVKQIGNYKQGSTWDNPQTGRVYSADGISPTLNTCGGGDREVKIIEPVVCIGGLQEHQTPRTDGISPSLTAAMGMGGGQTPMIVASRGRNPQNPSDRTPGNHVEQRLEPNSEGICNTLTSVQKDNLVLEPQLKIVDIPQTVSVRKHKVDIENLKKTLREHKKLTNKEIAQELDKPITMVEHWFRKDNSFSIPDVDIWHQLKELLGITTDEFDLQVTEFIEQDGVFEKANRCYMTDGISPTLTSTSADEKILVPFAIDEQNMRVRHDTFGTLTTDGSSPKHNNRVAVPTVKVKQATKDGYIECKLGGVADLSYPASKTRRGRVQDGGDTCPTLTATETGVCRIETPYRIRKLTPRECWRLMGFSDLDFFSAMLLDRDAAIKLMIKFKDDLNGIEIMREAETMQKMSNSQLYKQAGNSIVKMVLMAIKKQMIGESQ